MADVKISFTDPDKFRGYMQVQSDAMEDLDFRPVLEEFLVKLEDWHDEYFSNEHEPDGTAWTQLHKATIRRKGHDIILLDTERLVNSLIDESHGDSIRTVFHEGKYNGLVYGTSVPYAHFHMTGTSRMVARPFLGVTEGKVVELADDVLDFLVASFNDAK